MKVFISSVMKGFEPFRDAAFDAVETLGLESVRAEDFGTSRDSPRIACLEGVRSSDVFVLILGERYGALLPSGISATHEEFNQARERCEIVALVQEGVELEPNQKAFAKEVRDWSEGVMTTTFTNPESLKSAIIRELHKVALDGARGDVNSAELSARATACLPVDDRGYSSPVSVAVALAGAPRQTLLRPREIESAEIEDRLFEIGVDRRHKVLDRREGARPEFEDGALFISQSSSTIGLWPDGSLMVRLLVKSPDMPGRIVEETVSQQVLLSFEFMKSTLKAIDPDERLRFVCPAVQILGAEFASWSTAAEAAKNPSSMTISMGTASDRHPIVLEPPHLRRSAFVLGSESIAEDFTVLLRRQFA